MPPTPRKRTNPPENPLQVGTPQFRQPLPPGEPAPNMIREPVNPTHPTAELPRVESPVDALRAKVAGFARGLVESEPEGRTTTSGSRTDAFAKAVRDRIPLDPESALKATIAVVGLGVIIGSWVVRFQTKRALRQPTEEQSKAIAEPLSKIFARHFDMGGMAPDLLNGVEAAVALNNYVMEGPMVVGPEVRTGVPRGDLNQEENAHAV